MPTVHRSGVTTLNPFDGSARWPWKATDAVLVLQAPPIARATAVAIQPAVRVAAPMNQDSSDGHMAPKVSEHKPGLR